MIDLKFKKFVIEQLEKPNCEATFLLGAAINGMKHSRDYRERMLAEAIELFQTEYINQVLVNVPKPKPKMVLKQ